MRRKLNRIVEPETQAATGRCRLDANTRGPAGMQTDARKFDRVAERCLILQGSMLVGMVDCARTFERFDSFGEFRKAPNGRLYPQVFPVRARVKRRGSYDQICDESTRTFIRSHII